MWSPSAGRFALAVAIVTTMGVATGIAANAAQGHDPAKPKTALPKPQPSVNLPAAPLGQVTTPAALNPNARSFSVSAGGWTGLRAGVAWTGDQGHDARGALSITPQGTFTGAVSPSFPVVAGERYGASGWVKTDQRPGAFALLLRFYTKSHVLIDDAAQLGQITNDGPQWSYLLPVEGFAPDGAAFADVVAVSMSRKAGIAHYLDDVTVSQTVGKPARIAGPIRAQGNHIVDRLGRTVTLRGVSILGMEAPGRHDLPTWEQEVSVAREWGANMIRLPLSDQRLLAGSCSYDPSYLSTLDALVSSITDKGMVAVLDLHGLAFKPCGRPLLAPMPDRRAVDFWRIIASHYATNGLVVFELYNEPNSVTPAQWLHGGKVVFQGISYSFVGMQSLYDAVRATGATNLVLFNGLNWASALPGAARVTGATNWAWGVHVYNCPNGVPPKALCIPGPGGIYDPTRVVDRFAVVADSQPLLVTEFGWPNASDGRFNHNVIQLVESRGWSGWIAWALDGTNQGMFDLVRNLGPVENPTVSGMPIIDGMTRD